MQEAVSAFLQRVAERILEGEVDCVVDRLLLPLPAHVGNMIHLHKTKSQAKAYLMARHQQLVDAGVQKIGSEVLAYEPTSERRATVTVVWRLLDSQHAEIGRNQIRYFCTLLSDSIAISMVEHLSSEGAAFDPKAALATAKAK